MTPLPKLDLCYFVLLLSDDTPSLAAPSSPQSDSVEVHWGTPRSSPWVAYFWGCSRLPTFPSQWFLSHPSCQLKNSVRVAHKVRAPLVCKEKPCNFSEMVLRNMFLYANPISRVKADLICWHWERSLPPQSLWALSIDIPPGSSGPWHPHHCYPGYHRTNYLCTNRFSYTFGWHKRSVWMDLNRGVRGAPSQYVCKGLSFLPLLTQGGRPEAGHLVPRSPVNRRWVLPPWTGWIVKVIDL